MTMPIICTHAKWETLSVMTMTMMMTVMYVCMYVTGCMCMCL